MGGRISGETPFRRSRRTIQVAQPAAGQEWSLTVPAGHVYRLEAVRFQYVADANVASRYVRLPITDGNAEVARALLGTDIAATDDVTVSYWREAQPFTSFADVTAPLPTMDLQAGWTISTTTLNMQVGDQFKGIVVTVLDITVRGGPADLDDIPDLFLAVPSGPE